MEAKLHDPDPRPTRTGEPELDLYTIPSYSSWFSWDDIHETERAGLREFFDGSSITRTPKIYKEYRDFIINKYREDPSRRLTFTEIRKSLVGDVTLLHKVFQFLDKWGLINFGAISTRYDDLEREETGKFRVEDGPPNGVRVVAMPNSLKPLSVPQGAAGNADIDENGLKLPPLTSYSNVFGELRKQKGLLCGNCSESCDSGLYEYTKGCYVLCIKCFKDGSYGENKSKDDFKLIDNVDSSSTNEAVWTEAETLLLLESILKHGDDWDLVAQDVQTKTKLDCISKLIELPFGDLILSSAYRNGNLSVPGGDVNNSKQVPLSSSEHQDTVKDEDLMLDQTNVNEQNGDAVDEGPPLKRKRTTFLSDAGSSLMKQAALISTITGPDIAAAAAEAAFAALCDQTSCPREIFDGKDDFPTNGLWSPIVHSKPERAHQVEDSEIKERSTQSASSFSETQETSPGQNNIPLTLRLRTAIATALGAAAAHAKLLADKEDQEIENLVTTIIETQLRKLHYKINCFDNLELIMEKEYAELEDLKESLIEERIDVLQRAIAAGMPKWRDHTCVKS
ncbi:SWI/SNF complex subunit SWI3A isoform X1 [Hevea brasiliensis]|uniref:SWI/SNF complex subunit SWI3A isoform X1 n=1 Tax=Hevea brasiliensis TaxID=3981 RepID=UPI000B77790B|nr:SWI/SNF complex subunit SWI3A isoform X1 [Hevea brasiliensis]